MKQVFRILPVLVFVGLVAGCASLLAQTIPVPDKTLDPAKVPSGTYKVDPAHASVIFEINHMGFSTYIGRFDKFDATINYDASAPGASRFQATVAVDSIDTNDSVLEKKLKSSEFFDAGKYPTIHFAADSVKITGKNTGQIKGTLTMHGVSRPLVLDITFNGGAKNPLENRYRLGFAATATLMRSNFGIKAYVPLVGDKVTLRLNAEFIKQ